MRFVARNVLVMGLEAKYVTFSMKSIVTFMSNSNTFMTIHYMFPIITSCTFFFVIEHGLWV